MTEINESLVWDSKKKIIIINIWRNAINRGKKNTVFRSHGEIIIKHLKKLNVRLLFRLFNCLTQMWKNRGFFPKYYITYLTAVDTSGKKNHGGETIDTKKI